jgi:hypothetical protein
VPGYETPARQLTSARVSATNSDNSLMIVLILATGVLVLIAIAVVLRSA